jgi:O-acetyl-ADP-ribose deacetylase (regulator of RNase III)
MMLKPMATEPLWTFPIHQSTVRLFEGSITQVEADAIESTDDIYLSMGGGVSSAIRKAAGPGLREDTLKQPLPLRLGSVVVTTGGRLQAKYVFHAITLDPVTRPPVGALIAHIIKRILEIGAALEIAHIAIPLLGAGTAGLPKEDVLKYILQSVMYYMATVSFSLQKLTIVLYLPGNIQPVIDEFAEKVSSTARIQRMINKLKALREETIDDRELAATLDERLTLALGKLRKVFYFDGLEERLDFQESGPMRKVNSKEVKENLNKKLEDLKEEIENKQKVFEIKKRRLPKLELQQAKTGSSTPPEILMEIEETTEDLEKLNRELENLKAQEKFFEDRIESVDSG